MDQMSKDLLNVIRYNKISATNAWTMYVRLSSLEAWFLAASINL